MLKTSLIFFHLVSLTPVRILPQSAEMNDMYVWKGPGIWRQEAAYFLNQELLRNASRISFRCPAKLNASWNHPIGELAGAAGLCAHMTWFRMFGPAHDH